MKSCIKYYGGKGNGLGIEIYKYFPHKSQYDTYIEAFGGAGNLLLIKEPFGIEIYNDLEKNVYSLFKTLSSQKKFLKFKKLCDLSLYSRDIREEYKKDLKKTNLNIVERAYKYFYTNRTSINGIGGFAVSTECLRRGMSKSVSDFLSSIDGLANIHNRLSRVIIENCDGIELIKKHDRDRVFIYADSPYHFDTRGSARYVLDMDNEKQEKYIGVLLGVSHAKVLVSGYDCPLYNKLCGKGWERIDIKVKTIDGNHKPKNKIESLWRNYKTQEVCKKTNLWEN